MDDKTYHDFCIGLDSSIKLCKSDLCDLRFFLTQLSLYDQVKICDSMYDDLLVIIDQVNDAL